jgi:peptide/nickel transport system permease protein
VLTVIGRRALWSVPVLLIASFVLFGFVRSTFDPTDRFRDSRDVEAMDRERARLGLDRPIVEQYGDWATDFVRGDWGTSDRTNERVFPMVRRALWNTGQLLVWSVLLSAAVAVAIGVYSASRRHSLGDHLLTGLTFTGLSMPPFWFGLIVIQLLAVEPMGWFDLDRPLVFFVGLHGTDGGLLDYLRHLVLPVLTLTVQIVASWSRYQRAAMLDALSSDHVRTARAKGLRRRQVLVRHGLRNSLAPLVTVIAIDVGALLGGLVVTEAIFSISGMGRLFYDSLLSGDAPVLVAWLVVTAVFAIACNLLADLLYGVLDPRARAR